jgi:hypothetical protein
MKTCCSRETLALFIEDDLPAPQAYKVRSHVRSCSTCEEAAQQLERSQSFFKAGMRTPLHNAPSRQSLAAMRQALLLQIRNESQIFGWTLRLERALVLGFRNHRIAFAAVAILVIISASVLGQIRRGVPQTQVAIEGYRNWVFVGSRKGHGDAEPGSLHNVFVSPAAYSEYKQTGKFPDGTVFVLERVNKDSVALEASLKDSSRFPGGWGFFDLEENGRLRGSCRPCHEENGETDHVFTQYYSLLRPL